MKTNRAATRDYQECRVTGHLIRCRTLIMMPASAGEKKSRRGEQR